MAATPKDAFVSYDDPETTEEEEQSSGEVQEL
jgi:hypothetical protein